MALSYAIIGTGGIGGYYGGCLAHSGKDVHFLFHSDYEFVKQHGLQVDSVRGDFHLQQIHAYGNSNEMPQCDVVLVCMKTTNNHLLKEILSPIVHANTVVVLIQNGLGIEKQLSDEMPNVSVVGATAFICTTKIAPGHIHHAEYGSLTMAKYCGECESIMQQVAEDFVEAGVEVHIGTDLNSIRWKKLVWNIPYNGLTVVMNAATNDLTFNSDSRQLVIDLMEEVVAAGKACGAKISDTFVSKMIEMTEKMTPYSPSMRVDYDAHRPMEIQAMYTNPIQIAAQHGFAMKKTEVVEKQLRFLAQNR